MSIFLQLLILVVFSSSTHLGDYFYHSKEQHVFEIMIIKDKLSVRLKLISPFAVEKALPTKLQEPLQIPKPHL